MKNQEKFKQLLDKYVSDSLEPGELSELFDYIDSSDYMDVLDQHILTNAEKDIAVANLPAHRAQEIMLKILCAEKTTAQLIPALAVRRRRHLLSFLAAAMLIPAMLLTGFWLLHHGPSLKAADLITLANGRLTEKVNTGSDPMHVHLEDGSSIVLQPGAKLGYPEHFLSSKRQVYLEGAAFFQVARQEKRPFYVYHNNLVTQVLGTSFSILTDKTRKEDEVDVLSGRVEVYENPQLQPAPGKRNSVGSAGVILTPNQRVIYREEDRQFVPSVVAVPMPVTKTDTSGAAGEKKTGFVEEPLPHILSLLQVKYGIEIVVENENLDKCLFTGDIKEESLYDQLEIICTSLSATYETKGTKILIKGNGCQ